MATVVSRLEAVLTANVHDFNRKMDQSEGRMAKVGKVAGVAGLAIAGGLAVGLEKSVHAALDAQVSQNRLEQAFRNAHLEAKVYEAGIGRLEKAGRRLGFTDEQTKEALGSLITATHNYRKAASELSVVQDIARFKHVSLVDATKMLTMAQTGSQRAARHRRLRRAGQERERGRESSRETPGQDGDRERGHRRGPGPRSRPGRRL
jgi:hypothetical protein